MGNPDISNRLTQSTTLNNSPTTMSTSDVLKIVSVTRNDGSRNREAMEVEPENADDYTDSSSIYYTSKFDPKWYISNDTLNVIPTPAAGQSALVKHITADASIALTDTSLSNFPNELERGVILYAAKELLRKLLNVRNATLVGLSLTDTTIPSVITLSTISYTDASAGDASSTAVGAITVASVPKPDISGNLPTYSKPTTSVDFAAGSTGVDDWIDSEDPEMAQVALEKQAQLLQDYQLDIENEFNEFQKEVNIYRSNIEAELAKHNSDLQKAINQAQIDAADAQQEAQQATEVDVANMQKDLQISMEARAKDMEALVANNASKVNDYMARVESYAQQVNDNVQTYQLAVAEVAQDYQWYAQQYQMVQQDLLEFLSYYIVGTAMRGEGNEASADDRAS
jgi:hypothetical protein